jgi:Family of unknown function (DUF6111)
MLRLVEVALFLLPFGVVAVWRLLLPARGVPPWMVAAAAVFVLLLAGALVWLLQQDAAPAGSAYVPARVEHSRIIPSGEAPR